MKHKKYLIFLACEAVLLLAISVLSQRVNAPITSLFAFPFEQIANGLFLLAQSGSLGNGIALALLVCISVIPSVISFAGCGGKRTAKKGHESIVSLLHSSGFVHRSVILFYLEAPAALHRAAVF